MYARIARARGRPRRRRRRRRRGILVGARRLGLPRLLGLRALPIPARRGRARLPQRRGRPSRARHLRCGYHMRRMSITAVDMRRRMPIEGMRGRVDLARVAIRPGRVGLVRALVLVLGLGAAAAALQTKEAAKPGPIHIAEDRLKKWAFRPAYRASPWADPLNCMRPYMRLHGQGDRQKLLACIVARCAWLDFGFTLGLYGRCAHIRSTPTVVTVPFRRPSALVDPRQALVH